MPVKLHNEFSFDNDIFIDRFVAKNASRFPDFMNSLDKLKSQKQASEERLKMCQHEGKDYLDCLRVACSFVEKQIKIKEDETKAPDEFDHESCDPNEIGRIGMKKSELKTTINCLKNYEEHLNRTIETEKQVLQETTNKLANAYTILKEYPYTLHCIVIHEGEDNAGHYYSYIKNHIENKWFKYDDHRVSQVEEEQVLGEAYGISKLKTSAYLVMYVSRDIITQPHDCKSEFDYYVKLIPKDLMKEVNQDNLNFNEQLEESKNKELANQIMDHFKQLNGYLKVKGSNTSDRGLISFPIFCFKNQESIISQHVILNTAIQEKHPAKLSIECLDNMLENILLKAFNREIIYLSDQRQKALDNLKINYYLNLEISYLIHYSLESFMNENYQAALETTSYIIAKTGQQNSLIKLFTNKKDILFKHLQIYILYLLSKSNLDIVKGETDASLNKVSILSILVLNYIPHSSSLYDNLLTLLRHIYGILENQLGTINKCYKRLIDGIEKKTITKNHYIKPKLAKDIEKKVESLKTIDLLTWNEEEDSVYALFTKTTNLFKITYQPWFEVWRILTKVWDKPRVKEESLERIFEIEADALKIDIRTLG